jgi:hypothetical protein
VKTLLLIALISFVPAQWDGNVWVELDSTAKLSYVSGFMGGLEVAESLSHVRGLAMRNITPAFVVTELDVFYAVPENRYLSVFQAIFITGRRN